MISVAQIQPKKVAYGKDSIYEYPLTLTDYPSEYIIPPLMDSLPSGKYLINYNEFGEKEIFAFFFVSEGKINGIANCFEPDLAKVSYKDGIIHGKVQTYQYITDSWFLEKEYDFVNGEKQWSQREYFNFMGWNGELLLKSINYLSLDSLEKCTDEYYPNGQLKSHTVFGDQSNLFSRRDRQILGGEHQKEKKYWGWSISENKFFTEPLESDEGLIEFNVYRGYNGYEYSKMKEYKSFYPNGSPCMYAVYKNDSTIIIKAKHENGVDMYSKDEYILDSNDLKRYSYYNDRNELVMEEVLFLKDDGKYSPTWEEVSLKYNIFDSTTFSFRNGISWYREKMNWPRWSLFPEEISFKNGRADTLSYQLVYSGLSLSKKLYNLKNKEVTFDINKVDSLGIENSLIIEDTLQHIRFKFYRNTRKKDDVLYRRKGARIPFFAICFNKQNVLNGQYLVNNTSYNSFYLEKDGLPYSGEFHVVSTSDSSLTGNLVVKAGKLIHYISTKTYYGSEISNDLVLTSTFKNGYLTGAVKFHQTRYLFWEDNYSNGERISTKWRSTVSPGWKKWKTQTVTRQEYYYKNNYAHGVHRTFQFLKTPRGWFRKDSITMIQLSQENYIDGRLNGEFIKWEKNWSVYSDLQILNKSDSIPDIKWVIERGNYKNGFKDGLQYQYDKGVLYKKLNYDMGSQIGPQLTCYSDGDTIEYYSIDGKGKTGKYIKKSEIGNYEVLGQFENGTASGVWTYFNKYGNIKAELILDSVGYYQDYTTKKYFKRRNAISLNFLTHAGVYGVLKLYHSNQNLLAIGRVWNGKRVGQWDYYNEDGKKTESYLFRKDTLMVNGEKVKTRGSYLEYSSVGKVCGKGKFLSPMNIYDCSSDLTLKKYRKVIDFLFDENGDTLVSNGEGYYKGYSSNGILLKKGMISKSIEHGKWKYYDPNGNINEIGEFIYGLKDGLWLKGDLRGVDYENADCLLGSNSSNAEEEGEMIEISVINYRKGTKVSEATIKAYKN